MAAVLDQYLDNQGRRIATHVVLEAVLNAASHPKASMAYTSSQFIREDYVLDALQRGPYLEVAIWDDGDPIAYTLQQAIHDGREVKSAAYGFVEEEFTVKLVRTATGQPEIRILSTKNPGIDYNFPWLTVSAFLAGITSRPRAQGANSKSTPGIRGSEEELPAELWDRGGIGLYLIRKNVIDLFKGRIRYMCQNYRMSMSSGGDRGVYDVLIQHRPDNSWPLRGNLMILEIPLG
ncbi:hypothetical protein OG579_03415 [Williamsia herbipolensis]|uniref:Uncharacterized protein n=1 Tax=Williamsia herbipolensis TaxID=1603258 RepID=A0AAU4K4D4_9NOCA|nr:hypothetical protein [Williamsia herbipolensis]